MKKDPQNSMSLCFDVQQVQPLPKLAIGEAYYARQLSYYALGTLLTLITHFPTFYCWAENQAKRGAIKVSSALSHFLTNYNFKEKKNISLLRHFSDDCAGQNRNAHVVHALYWWLLNKSPDSLMEICMTFSVRGHSFLQTKRMFDILEKNLRKHSEILTTK
ncbi:hypothetical protein ANN_20587 [Periplaneta americana]|uniref:Uncharacterized protein n=1 Tax=Periplaneta americana TaxID=6978 RepID=A0ABQ8SDH2_PERAM|nr:hypothetical protein ANN_20587 [Periplaneta americana]